MAESRATVPHQYPVRDPDERPDRDRFVSGAVRPLFHYLTTVAMRVIDDEELARDAVQEALLSLWLEEEMPDNPRGWLIRAVTYRGLHLARCRSRRRKHERNARLARPEASDRDDPSRFLEGEEWGQVLVDSLGRLAADHRDILALSLVEELDYRSIAHRLGIPIGTVRSRLNRARNALRDFLTRTLPEETRGWSDGGGSGYPNGVGRQPG